MGRSGNSEQQIPRWSVKRTRSLRASQGAYSQLPLQLARLLEPEGSQQAQLATQGDTLPGPLLREDTDGTELPTTPLPSLKFEDFFVPDSPEEILSRGKDSSHHGGPCKVPQTPSPSTNFEELVVPDSPEETWGASPCKLSRTSLTSTDFEELVVPESPEESGACKDCPHRPCKLRRTTSLRKFHQKTVDDATKSALVRDCSELLSPIRTVKRSGKLSFKDAADSRASYRTGQYDSGFPVLPAAEKTRSPISNHPAQMDFKGNLNPQATLIHAADGNLNPMVIDELSISSPVSNSCSASGRPLAVSSASVNHTRPPVEDEELDNRDKSQEQFHRASPTLYVPDTEEDDGAPVTPFSTTSGMFVPSSMVLIKPRRSRGDDSVKEVEMCGRAGARVQTNLHRDVQSPIPPSSATPAPATPFPTEIAKLLSVPFRPMKKAKGDELDGSENCAAIVRAGHQRILSRDVLASKTDIEEAVPRSFFVTGSGKRVPVSPTAFRKVRALLEAEVDRTELGADFSRAEYQENVHGNVQNSSNTLKTDGASPRTSVSSAVEKTSSALRDVVQTPTPNPMDGAVSISPSATGNGKLVSVSYKAQEQVPEEATVLEKTCSRNGSSRVKGRGNVDFDAQTVKFSNTEDAAKTNSSLMPTGKNLSDDQTSPNVTDGEVPITFVVEGSGKPVSVSSKALQMVGALLGGEFEDLGRWDEVGGARCQGNVDRDVRDSKSSNTEDAAPINSSSMAVATTLPDAQTPPNVMDGEVPITSFVTGSVKPFAVSSVALEKASALLGAEFEEIESCNEPGGAGFLGNVHGDIQTLKFLSTEDIPIEKSSMASGKTVPTSRYVIGDPVAITSFVTGSGKSVSVSSKALERARVLLGAEFEEAATGPEFPGAAVDLSTLCRSGRNPPAFEDAAVAIVDYGSGNEKPVSSSIMPANNGTGLSGDGMMHARNAGVITSTRFCTGNGEPMSPSSFAVEKAKELGQGNEVENDGHSTFRMHPGLVNQISTFKDDAFASKNAEMVLGDWVKNDSNAGRMTLSAFLTGSGGHISVSSSAMQRARELLGDDEVEDHPTVLGILRHNNQVPSAKPGHAKRKAPLGDEEKENHVEFERTSSYLECPLLARNSEFATDRIRKLRPLPEIQVGSPTPHSADQDEKVGPASHGKLAGSRSSHHVQKKEIPEGSLSHRSRLSGRRITISDEAIQAAKLRLARPGERKGNAFSQAAEEKLVDSSGSSTFKTGYGRTVSVEAVEKAKSLLADCAKVTSLHESINCDSVNLATPMQILSPAPTSQTPSGRKFAISREAMSRSKALLAPIEAVGDTLSASSFVTGSGKSVSLSSKALDKARVFFGEESEKTTPVKTLADPVAVTSFVTGSGKSVSISSKALEKARALFQEEFEDTPPLKNVADPVAVTSFVTGSGKSVSISSKALEKARAFFGEEFEETAAGTSHHRDLDAEGNLSESKFGHPSLICDKPSPELNLDKSDAAGSFGAQLSFSAGGEYQWRNVRAFKSPRIRKQSDDTINYKGNISASISGANSCDNQRLSLNSITVADGHQQFQPPRPGYLKEGRSGWMTLQEYIEGTPANDCKVLFPSPKVKSMTPIAAENYKIHHVTEGGRQQSVGSTEIWELLLHLGADTRYATKEWVANHYKWIIWKLTSSYRNHPRQAARKCLTFDTVLEELKYRYDTELSGRRSAIRRITEGDSSASRAMVLLVSALDDNGDNCGALEERTGNASSSSDTAKIEVTDGWYRLNAVLDAPLTKQLREGKLKVGQKIRVCGATLCCCPDSTPPLEAFRDASLALHINGTYRVPQNHHLGFCRGPLLPLAFRCIKPDGGLVPKTYVGVARVYPMFFKETSANGFSVVRSARAEELAADQFEQRRAKAVEEAILKLENSCDPSKSQLEKDEEGYELFDAVERASEPDVLMADMTPLQLNAFAVYQAKRETSRQASIEDTVKGALQEAGLYSRNVKRFLKVRVTGLQRRGEEDGQVGQARKEGMISIWDISDDQDIVEGSVYCVSGLRPVTRGSSSNEDQLHLQSYRSTSWRHVAEAIYEKHFSFPYTCRAPTLLSDMDEKSVYREFDVAAMVLVVDDPFSCGSRTNQWVFMTDGSTSRNSPGDAWDEIQILAVKLSLPALAFAPVDASLVGSVVGFCNLVQQPKDYNCHWWVAEASDLCFFSSNLASDPVKHLQTAANRVVDWNKSSPWAADSLRNLIQAMMSQGAQWHPF